VAMETKRFTAIGATTRQDLISAPLRGRFGLVLALNHYDQAELASIVIRSANLLDVAVDEEGADEIARRSRGTPRIANRLLRRVRDYAQVRASGEIDVEVARRALDLLEVAPSGTDEIHRNIMRPERGLSQVAGMAHLKEQLMHEVIGPFKDPELWRRYRVSLPNGILFYGPPGCGKTYIARALAEELGWSFYYCRPSDVASPYIHDTVSKIRGVFAVAIEKAPSVVFIDEFEAFVPARSELGGHQQYKAEEVNEFLANLEGCAERKVLVIGATNEPDKIDPAVRRSGRFDKLIFISPPDVDARRAMLDFHLQDRPIEAAFDATGIAAMLEGYSASDIKLLVDEAARMALKRGELISTRTVLTALERVPPSISADDMLRYSGFRSRGI
jgi:SpoVK/Ycf46/Vps4 family AAA+-type ATPase